MQEIRLDEIFNTFKTMKIMQNSFIFQIQCKNCPFIKWDNK